MLRAFEGLLRRAGLRVLNFSYTETVKGDDGLTGVDDMYESISAHDFTRPCAMVHSQ